MIFELAADLRAGWHAGGRGEQGGWIFSWMGWAPDSGALYFYTQSHVSMLTNHAPYAPVYQLAPQSDAEVRQAQLGRALRWWQWRPMVPIGCNGGQWHRWGAMAIVSSPGIGGRWGAMGRDHDHPSPRIAHHRWAMGCNTVHMHGKIAPVTAEER